MTLGQVIYNYRQKNNLSLRAFAIKSGVSYAYVGMLEKGFDYRSNKPISPTLETVRSIARAVGLSVDDLLKIIDEDQPLTINSNVVKVLGSIPAGIPLEMIEDVVDSEEISPEMLKGEKEFFGLKIRGDSMSPEYLDGDTIIVEKCEDCNSGDDCVVAVNGQDATFKRVIKNEAGIILQPLNASYSPVVFSFADIKNKPVRILGVVRELRRRK